MRHSVLHTKTRIAATPTLPPLLPALQDDYLDEGYFRSAHTIRQTRFVFLERQLWSTIWSRVPLQTYALKKRQRKLFKMISARFHVSVQPYTPSEEQDELYHVYQREHPLDVASSMAEVLGQHAPTHKFDTYSLHVRDAERLIAFSCFDRGHTSLASIFGCYHPEFSALSLGTFTLLGELAYGKSQGLDYYHPGYCVPGVKAFDYKLRLPDLEGKTYVSGHWQPMASILERALPHQLIAQRIRAASTALVAAGIPHQIIQLPLCEMMDEIAHGYGPLPHPLMIELTDTNPLGEAFIGFDLPSEAYELWYGQPVGNLRFEPDFGALVASVDESANLKFYEWRTRVFTSSSIQELVPVASGRALLATILKNLPFWAIEEDSSSRGR